MREGKCALFSCIGIRLRQFERCTWRDALARLNGMARKNSRIFTAVSLFCGAGGLDLGFDRAGFKTIWANDFNADACDTFRSWSRAKVVCGDVTKIKSSEIPDSDIMLGGFPCQGFSLSGPRRIDDSRNVLYKEYVRILKAKMPLAFVGENVKGLLTMGNGRIVDAIIEAFHQCGYKVKLKLLNAADYGVPQDRERVIIVGIREDLQCGEFVFPTQLDRRVTLRETIWVVLLPRMFAVLPSRHVICRVIGSVAGMRCRLLSRRWQNKSLCIRLLQIWLNLARTNGDLGKREKRVALAGVRQLRYRRSPRSWNSPEI